MIIFAKLLLEKQIITGQTSTALLLMAVASSDPEVQIDAGLEGFGCMAGLSLGCVATEQRKVMDLNAAIGRLRGIERAFLFTASFGSVTGVEPKIENCRTVLARYEIRREVREDVRDQYWRNGRCFRDGRDWDRDDDMRRYDGHHDDNPNNAVAGVVIGAAVVGVAAAIISSQDDRAPCHARPAGFVSRASGRRSSATRHWPCPGTTRPRS